MNSTDGHYDSWHNDVKGERYLALSVNLSMREYRGGGLQLRRRGAGEILREIRNTGLGNGLVFRISRELEHCILPVEGDAPKTALAGWFRKAQSPHELIRHPDRVQRSESESEKSSAILPKSASSSG